MTTENNPGPAVQSKLVACNLDDFSSNKIERQAVPHNHSIFWALSITMILFQCSDPASEFDASGTFEAREIIVSAEINGTIKSFHAEEGDLIMEGEEVIILDPLALPFQKAQIESAINALQEKQFSALPQIQILEEMLKSEETRLASNIHQLEYLQSEKERTLRLIEGDAAVPKQLDEIVHQITLQEKQVESNRQQLKTLRQQISSHKQDIQLKNRSINSEKDPLTAQLHLVEDQLSRSRVKNPVRGTLLVKYSYIGEFVTPGKALYKIADMSQMTLRAYISGGQLPQVKLGQSVRVFVDNDEDYLEYEGTIHWISDQAEFTPKTIQTKDERENLVYAIKIKVPNDGSLKIGMFGELKLN